jgi:hypothetical protein
MASSGNRAALSTIDRLVGEGLVMLEAVRIVTYPATAGG